MRLVFISSVIATTVLRMTSTVKASTFGLAALEISDCMLQISDRDCDFYFVRYPQITIAIAGLFLFILRKNLIDQFPQRRDVFVLGQAGQQVLASFLGNLFLFERN